MLGLNRQNVEKALKLNEQLENLTSLVGLDMNYQIQLVREHRRS